MMNSFKKNIFFCSLQGINHGKPEGMLRILIPILENINLPFKYYVSFINGFNNYKFPIYESSILHKVIFKSVNAIRHFIFPNSNYAYFRLIQEYSYDFFLQFKLRSPVILVSSTHLPISFKKNKNIGGFNILYAGNPYEIEISKILNLESNKLGINYSDVYTNKIRLDFINKSLLNVDYILSQSTVSNNTYIKYFGVDKCSLIRMEIIPSPILFNKLEVEKNIKLTFIMVAHPSLLKGLQYLVEAWVKVCSNSNVQLLIIGNVDKHVSKLIQKLNTTSIVCLGPIYGQDLNMHYRKAHVCIVPSLLDNHPATVSEALECGVPVIVTNGCGSSHLIVNEYNGFVVESFNSGQLFEKIHWFILNQDKIPKMSENALKSAEVLKNSNYHLDTACHLYDVISEVII